MAIWQIPLTPEALNAGAANTMVSHLGITVTEVGDDFIRARMPVDERTIQPAGILHGGASAALAETLGSIAANFCVDPSQKYCVGLEINANHVRPMRQGYVTGEATPVHIGASTQIWQIRITNEEGKLVCISRLTMAVLERK